MTVVGHRRLRIGACLSLTGRYSRFGTQAATGLEAWRMLDGHAELLVEDDGSDPARVGPCLRAVAGRCDLLLGPYSTRLMRAASRAAPDLDRLVWNHGGSGDDVASVPDHVVSVLSPTSRYAEPFLRHLAAQSVRVPLWLVQGRGSFARQIIAGAVQTAKALGLRAVRVGSADDLRPGHAAEAWDLFCAGSFEEDVATVTAVRMLPRQPRLIGAVAAGVRDFKHYVTGADGIYGIAQWFPGRRIPVETGPAEEDFLRAYSTLTDAAPDYPAAQTAAAAILATHCARTADSTARERLWAMAAGLRTTTLFGAFQIDPASGAQLGHDMTLVRWTPGGLASAPPDLV